MHVRSITICHTNEMNPGFNQTTGILVRGVMLGRAEEICAEKVPLLNTESSMAHSCIDRQGARSPNKRDCYYPVYSQGNSTAGTGI
jgi:hypothetical protein